MFTLKSVVVPQGSYDFLAIVVARFYFLFIHEF